MYRIFNHLGDISACTHYRNNLPTIHCREELRNHGIQLENKILFTGEVNYDCYIFSRLPFPRNFLMIEKLYRAGKKIIWDIDDELWNVPKTNRSYEGCEDLKGWLNYYLAMSSAVVTSNSHLARSLSDRYGVSINKIRVLENLVDINDYTRFSDPHKSFYDEKIKIMWSGSENHVGDLGPIKVLFDYYRNRDDVIFLFFGHLPDEFKALSAGDVLYIPVVNKKFYEPIISMISPHIALQPLDETQFNRCKSGIKYLEFSMCESVSLASDVAPYSDIIEDRKDGFLCHDPDDWVKNCDWALNNRVDASLIAREARIKVTDEYSWNTDNQRRRDWLDFFKSIPDLAK